MRFVVAAFAVVFVVAATPAETAPDVATDGFHVDPTVSATDECVEAAVLDARADGGTLFVVVLAEEPAGGATAFAAGLLELVGDRATVFAVAPATVDYADSQEFWSVEELDQALAASKRVASDNDVVRTFVNNLTGGDAVCANSSTEGKSGWANLVMLVIIVGGVIFLVGRSVVTSRRKRVESGDR
jgi:hypothetical protein